MPLPSRSAEGDAHILAFEPRGQSGRVRAFAHADGGVTLCRYDNQENELERISLIREDWQAVVGFVEEFR